ncbi:hypothetical protein U1Q18_025620 [Sarracenia purpurea var. burkii]
MSMRFLVESRRALLRQSPKPKGRRISLGKQRKLWAKFCILEKTMIKENRRGLLSHMIVKRTEPHQMVLKPSMMKKLLQSYELMTHLKQKGIYWLGSALRKQLGEFFRDISLAHQVHDKVSDQNSVKDSVNLSNAAAGQRFFGASKYGWGWEEAVRRDLVTPNLWLGGCQGVGRLQLKDK